MQQMYVIGNKSPQIGQYVDGAMVIGECSSLGAGNGKFLKADGKERLYCNIQVGMGSDSYRVLIASDSIKDDAVSWMIMCKECGRNRNNR